MKRLLAYLFVVLGLGIYFNDHVQAKNYCIPKKVEYVFQSIYIFKDCYVYHKKVDLDTFVEFALTHPLQTVGIDKESPLLMEENLKWLKKYLKENNISSSKLKKSIKRFKIANSKSSQTQKVAKKKSENLYIERMLTKQEKLDIAKGKIKIYKCSSSTGTHFQKDGCIGDYYKKELLTNKGLLNFYLLRDYTNTQIAKAEPSQTQELSKDDEAELHYVIVSRLKKWDSINGVAHIQESRQGVDKNFEVAKKEAVANCTAWNEKKDCVITKYLTWNKKNGQKIIFKWSPINSDQNIGQRTADLTLPWNKNRTYYVTINNEKVDVWNIKTQIAKAEPSKTKKVAKKENIKFCVTRVDPSYTSYYGYKYKVRRFDNPYYTCKSDFIIDDKYKDDLFYAYLVDTIGFIDTGRLSSLKTPFSWKPKNPIKPKKKVKVAKVEEPKQEEFKPENKDIDNDAPVIEIAQNIIVDSQTYTLKGKVKDKSKLYLEANGRPLKISKRGNFELEGFVVDPDAGDKIKIVAIDQWKNKSEKTINIKVEFKEIAELRSYEKPNPSKIKVKQDKNKIAIIIGIEKYKTLKNIDAPYANRDANAFRAYANRALGIPNKNIKVLIDENATRGETLKALTLWLPQIAREKNKDIYVFFAGHGLASDDGKNLYILPQDGDAALLQYTALSRLEIFDLINRVEPNSVTMFFDTCYSGQTRDERMLVAGLRPIRLVAEEQEVQNNFTIFTASNYDQTSGSIEEAKHGIFSYYLMMGMQGKADSNQDKKITNGELIAYLKQNVSEEAFTQNREQDPMLVGDPDKVLISYR